jgi:hypothetical protein
MIWLQRAAGHHALEVAQNLCREDRHELALFGAASPEHEVVCSAADACTCDVVLGDDGTPVALCGVSGIEKGRIWMLRTPALWATTSHRRQIPGIAKTWVEKQQQSSGPVLWNWALASNTGNLKWLRTLGFIIDKPSPMGPSAALFSYFWRLS